MPLENESTMRDYATCWEKACNNAQYCMDKYLANDYALEWLALAMDWVRSKNEWEETAREEGIYLV